MARLTVRNTTSADIPALIELQRRVYPTIPPWEPEQMRHQLEVFPQGQMVALYGERVVGGASALIVLWDDWADEHSWQQITASGSFDNHNPQGRTLYGAEVFVDPRLRGQRVGHALYEARRTLCRRANLRRIIACGRLPGYARHAARMDVEEYVKRVLWGDLHDPVLGFQLKEGFRCCGVTRDYIPQDAASGGHASLIVWLNPHFDPARPTRIAPGDEK